MRAGSPKIPVTKPKEPPRPWQILRARLPEGAPRRTLGIVAALGIEALILLALLALGVRSGPEVPIAETIASFDAIQPAEQETEAAADNPAPVPAPAAPSEPQPVSPIPLPPSLLQRESTSPPPPDPDPTPEPEPTPETPATQRARAVIRPGANYGPADTGRRGGPDTEVVGTAPDGSPLYAAQWFTEPTQQQLAGFLSGVRGPGWGLIACRTAPNWRVEDCTVLGESPAGSNIANAFNAASFQFLVRPPRIGGEYQVGAWVRIRLTLGSGGRPGA